MKALQSPFLAAAVVLALLSSSAAPAAAKPKPKPNPVLMVIANQDFYYQEYFETRESLEAAGLEVVVAAATTETAIPHRTGTFRRVRPDLALADVSSVDYSGIFFVGGYGAASYQYANETTYDNPAYRPDPNVVGIVNDLINDFVAEDKPVGAICYGVSVLAYARVDGESLLEGKTVVAWAGTLPGFELDGAHFAAGTVPARWQIESNGATMLYSGAVGDPLTSQDDVIVDGNIITAENYDSAYVFSQKFRELVSGQAPRG